MIILSDCLTEKVDEGCINVAYNLTINIKKMFPDTKIISYKSKPSFTDEHLKLNRFFLNKKLKKIISKMNQPILYIPFASNTFATSIRAGVLSLQSAKPVSTVFTLRHPMDKKTELAIKLSGINIITLSNDSYCFYKEHFGNKVHYLKTGVNCIKFSPVDEETKLLLRKKYNIPANKKVVLHVGHLKKDRNVDKLLNISKDYHVILVVSSVTAAETDERLKEKLLSRKNITLIDTFIENIEELYQLSDVYLFPVMEHGHCIDVPLSVLEAASCNIPVVTTPYGELKTFIGKQGFIFIDSLDADTLNKSIDRSCSIYKMDVRGSVLKYDWMYSIPKLIEIVEG